MARRGAKVTLHGRNQANLDAVKEEIVQVTDISSDVISVTGDVTDAAVREKIVSETLDAFGQIDILVNNAGDIEYNIPLLQVTRDNLNANFDLLLHAPIHLSQLCHPHLAKTKGNLVNISSIAATAIFPGIFSYSCAKTSLNIFTGYAAAEFGKDGIRVNSISPGPIKTPLFERERPGYPNGAGELLQAGAAMSALGIYGEAEDVAEIVAFYASDAARLITGDNNINDAGISLPFLFKGPQCKDS
ncbi:uncharacterized oxidoreductase MexAM1_META1p0182 [Aplysia californica]|uniref:Uncharacterized oxidoreductase MexAM1_META1p0182 n=1 Tax=Aplysia californica TaxID=6500 RepID=A0ABM1AEG3_APLCA|nr:uncharacterized oxidoreductase MexAM1_META1p0182 [Aplysia californica]